MPELPTTQWSLIRASSADDSGARRAWETLLADYHRPIRAFFRRSPLAPDADDLTQAFIEQSIAGGWWSRADQDRGTFRSFLYLLLRRFLAKRLRDRPPEADASEDDLADRAGGAEHAFDVAFVLNLTEQAVRRLRAEYAERGRAKHFEQLAPLLNDPPAHGELKAIAAHLGLRPNTLTVELRRLRQRLRKQLEGELRQLCLDDARFEAEMNAIRSVLAGFGPSQSGQPG